MAVSFITRFRRHIAVIPFVIVLLVPVALVVLLMLHRDHSSGGVDPSARLMCTPEIAIETAPECSITPED
ncbi:MAG: hypothetical protein ACFHX7_24970 [Pseudomonadota bacterium]